MFHCDLCCSRKMKRLIFKTESTSIESSLRYYSMTPQWQFHLKLNKNLTFELLGWGLCVHCYYNITISL